MKKQPRGPGKIAVEILKEAHRAGTTGFDRPEACKLLRANGVSTRFLLRHNVAKWMRKAQLELAADEGLAVAHRVQANGYEAAAPATRKQRAADLARYRGTATGLRNDLVMKRAAAAAPDATAVERTQVFALEQAVTAVEFALAELEADTR